MTDDYWKKNRPASSSCAGYRPLHDIESEKSVKREETTRERAERQRLERQSELSYTKNDEDRWAQNCERVLAERGELGKNDTSHINFFLKKKTEVPKFDLDEVLVTPELDAIKPIHIDPPSMLADDIESFTKEGKEFIKNPTLVGAASMAVIAIPGKFLDDVGGNLAKTAFERNPFKELRGRKIINSDLAGKAIQTKGGVVFVDYDGFPDFTPYAEKIVRIDGLNGKMAHDVALAMKKLNLNEYDQKNMVWHHHQDGKTLMLVPRNVHSTVNGGLHHSGGRNVLRHNAENPLNQISYPSPEEKF
ncbi:HNH endonuclease [uncultured Vibrio sp.]|uniref:HNH endonuclease signature motif containing protein n=1 Tax=uncultured Vibrio sp. TaxID=114054 RepID=UPI0026199E76|nr:HNH endonuclease [uncultured Vibrio sp.]